MIRVDNERLSFEGNKIDLMSELTVLIRTLKDDGVINKEDLDYVIKLADMDREALRKQLIAQIADSFIRFMNEKSKEDKENKEDKNE